MVFSSEDDGSVMAVMVVVAAVFDEMNEDKKFVAVPPSGLGIELMLARAKNT